METGAPGATLGLALPEPPRLRPGTQLPSALVPTRGNRACVSDHGPGPTGLGIAGSLGKVGSEATVGEAAVAWLTAPRVLGSVRRTLGDLDRVSACPGVSGKVGVPEFCDLLAAINGLTNGLVELDGGVSGRRARSVVGRVGMPFGIPAGIGAEVEVEFW